MTNKKLIEKLQEDMEMRGFSHYTKDSYLRKAKEIIEYFGKPMKQVTTKELREFLIKYLKEEKKISERSVNYYNSVIRFIYDVVLDTPINQKQIPMYKKKRRLPKILSDEELNIFFDACDNYMYETIFMMIYGSGLRISEATNLRVEDIDSENMRLFVRNGKGERQRYTVLPKASLEMLRKCYKMYKPNHPEGYMFLNREGNPLKVERLRVFFRRYRRRAKISEDFIVHSLRHSFATKLVEEGAPIELTGGGKITDETVLNPLKQVKVSKYSKSGIISGQTRVLPNDTSSYREVDVVVGEDGTSYDAVENNRKTAGFTKTVGETTSTMTLAEMAQIMVDEYETMIKSIEKYHGFYIGRYELTADGEKPGATLTSRNWYQLYANCKTLSASDKAMTRMIWGCQWDVTCKWIANYGDQKSISNPSTWGNYRNYNTANGYSEEDVGYEAGAGSKQNTGSSENWKANNIYDFTGNCYEWTQEAYYANCRTNIWGGYCDEGSGSKASRRENNAPTYDDFYGYLRFSSHSNSATMRVEGKTRNKKT